MRKINMSNEDLEKMMQRAKAMGITQKNLANILGVTNKTLWNHRHVKNTTPQGVKESEKLKQKNKKYNDIVKAYWAQKDGKYLYTLREIYTKYSINPETLYKIVHAEICEHPAKNMRNHNVMLKQSGEMLARASKSANMVDFEASIERAIKRVLASEYFPGEVRR